MKILDSTPLAIEAVKTVTYARFRDHRGYFTEHYRRSDFHQHPAVPFMKGVELVQCNESFSRAGTLRGLHFQWNPYMGKLVRTLSGRMIDIVLDIRKGSPTFGKALLHDMPSNPEAEQDQWIWVPPGFAHGYCFPQDSLIEYLCSGEYSQTCEAGISPLANDIDWSLSHPELKRTMDRIVAEAPLITEKDRNGLTVGAWAADERAAHFAMERLP